MTDLINFTPAFSWDGFMASAHVPIGLQFAFGIAVGALLGWIWWSK